VGFFFVYYLIDNTIAAVSQRVSVDSERSLASQTRSLRHS
jgi:hypothetical protein